MSDNPYIDEIRTVRRIAEAGHRAVVGGLWSEIGELQALFLKSQGLLPRHRLLDIGCGSLRAGLPLCRYLNPGHYFGIDISESLIRAGYEQEIVTAGLADRLPFENLAVITGFQVPFATLFDFGLATSVFTHMPLENYTACLLQMRSHFIVGAQIFATVFEGSGTVEQVSGIVSHDDRDPYHFTRVALELATPGGWKMVWIGDWGHPRNQKMVRLVRC